MKYSTHTIQGVSIRLHCDYRLHSRISNYFNFFYKGETRRLIKPILYELSIAEDPPAVPAEAVRAVKTEYVSCYKHGSIIYYVSEDGSVVYLDPASGTVRGYLREKVLDNAVMLYSLAGAPFSDMMKYHSLYSLHSAALCRNGAGYLFSGDSGSGKTTSTLGLVVNGFKYASDDVVLLEEVQGEVRAHSLTRTFNVDRKSVERFPGILKEEDLPVKPGAKVMVRIEDIIPGSFVPGIRPDVIIFLKIISSEKSRLHPLRQLEVFRRLLKQSAMAADNEVSQGQLKILGQLARQVRGFELQGGRDIYEDPARLVDLIAGIGGLA